MVTVVDLPLGAHLHIPDEPVDLRDRLYAEFLDGADWREGFDEDVCLAVWLWCEWQPALEPAGFERDVFVTAVADYGREIWLWLAGERTWSQCVEGLAGRIARRVPPVLS